MVCSTLTPISNLKEKPSELFLKRGKPGLLDMWMKKSTPIACPDLNLTNGILPISILMKTSGVCLVTTGMASLSWQTDTLSLRIRNLLPGGSNMVKTRFHSRSEEHTSELQSRGHLVC